MIKENSSNNINKKAFTVNCPITATLLEVGGRWKIIILWQLKDKPLRYSEVKKSIPNISEKMLIQQLKDLVNAGWVYKKDYNTIPPKTEYALTDKGKSFIVILDSIYDWGIKNNMVEKK